MLHHYFKVAIRNLLKNRLSSIINISGLAIGMTCFILIALYIQYEFSYDTHHEQADQIYRVSQIQEGNDFRGTNRFALAPLPLAPALKEAFPEIKAATTFLIQEDLFIRETEAFAEDGMFADEYVFDVFTIPVIEGIGRAALQDPNSIILTSSFAKKHFGEASPIGKTLLLRDEIPLKVAGVIEDAPKSQHFSYNYITSYKNYSFYENDLGAWNSNNYRAYIALEKGTDYKELQEKLVKLDQYGGTDFDQLPETTELFLQPLTDIHLHSRINFELAANGDIRYIYLFASIALVILLLASINYMNLATARSARRAKEVGVRKVIGARKRQLVYQLLGESFLITLLSFSIAMLLAELLLPAFNQLLDQQIPFSLSGNRGLLLGTLSIAFLISVGSGLYPAVFLSAVAPVKALKGGFLKNYKEGAFLRNTLVVGQFTAAIVLAVGSVVIYQQLQYIQNKKLGYNREQVIYAPYQRQEVFDKTATIRNELLKHPQIDEVSISTYMPLNMLSQGTESNWEGNNDGEEIWIYRNYVDHHFIDLFEIELLEGRNFSPDFPTDSTGSYILNEAAVKALGWESAVGKEFANGKVIGVVKDFHIQPFSLAIEPMYLTFHNEVTSYYFGNIILKAKMDDPEAALSHLQSTLKTVLPQLPFEYNFMDDAYNELYSFEKRVGRAFNIFTLLALFIACIGLFGLVAHQVLQRTKEIGIRKVLGATVPNIVGMLSTYFLKLVVMAAIIAFPIAWWAMNKWLEDFAYRIEIDWSVFALAGILALAVTLFTVSSQAIKAALANPVEALRSE